LIYNYITVDARTVAVVNFVASEFFPNIWACVGRNKVEKFTSNSEGDNCLQRNRFRWIVDKSRGEV